MPAISVAINSRKRETLMFILRVIMAKEITLAKYAGNSLSPKGI